MRTRIEWQGVLRPGKWLAARAAGWGVALVVAFAGSTVVLNLAARQAHVPQNASLEVPLTAGVLAGAVSVYALAVRTGERRRVTELALPRLLPEAAAGLAAGILLFSLVMAALLAAGAYGIAAPRPGAPWTGIVQEGLAPAVFEEVLFRGILMRLIWEAFGLGAALLASSALFGLAHLANPGHSLVGALAIMAEAGLMLGSVFALTERLWACMGLHAGWNFTQGYVFGAPVSGTAAIPHLFAVTPRPGAPGWLTGGGFGPEASLVAVAAGLAAGMLALLLLARRRQGAPVAS